LPLPLSLLPPLSSSLALHTCSPLSFSSGCNHTCGSHTRGIKSQESKESHRHTDRQMEASGTSGDWLLVNRSARREANTRASMARRTSPTKVRRQSRDAWSSRRVSALRASLDARAPSLTGFRSSLCIYRSLSELPLSLSPSSLHTHADARARTHTPPPPAWLLRSPKPQTLNPVREHGGLDAQGGSHVHTFSHVQIGVHHSDVHRGRVLGTRGGLWRQWRVAIFMPCPARAGVRGARRRPRRPLALHFLLLNGPA